MFSGVKWTILLLALVALLQSATALRCWSCSSNMNAQCGDPMNATEHQGTFHVRHCDNGPYETSKPVCRKIITKVNGERVVIRQCSTLNIDEMDIVDGPCGPSAVRNQNSVESCHICSTDLCNSATNASAMYLLYGVAMLFVGLRFLQTKSFV